MSTVVKPTQANSPFMKRVRSRISVTAVTTRRSISRKSPASGVISIPARRLMMA